MKIGQKSLPLKMEQPTAKHQLSLIGHQPNEISSMVQSLICFSDSFTSNPGLL